MRSLLAACLFVFFLVETAVVPWMLPHGWLDFISLRFVLVGIFMIGLFLNRYFALVLGLVFGFILDMTQFVYMFGLYTSLFGLAGYLTGLSARRYALHFTPTIVAVASGLFLFESTLYLIYTFYDRIDISYFYALIRNILPSIIVNTAFAALIYRPAERLLLEMQTYEKVEE
jgi:rod shape-determining protein MreD